MSRIDRDVLRREQEADEALEKSFEANPVKRVIQELFHNEFSGTKYRKLGGISAVRDLALLKLKEAVIKPGPYSSAVVNLSSKIKRAKTYEEVLMALNEYLFS
jgi:hypothetical protein